LKKWPYLQSESRRHFNAGDLNVYRCKCSITVVQDHQSISSITVSSDFCIKPLLTVSVRDSLPQLWLRGGDTMDKLNQIAERIRDIREAQGLTQAQLAERIGLSSNYIGMIEQGIRHVATIETLLKFADGLKTSPQYLLPTKWLVNHAKNEELINEMCTLAAQVPDRRNLEAINQLLRSLCESQPN
jgi:XRE family transcriptional regulator, regulator of sulfur utilization